MTLKHKNKVAGFSKMGTSLLLFAAIPLVLILSGCAQGSNPATQTPSATTSGDKAVDSVAATYRVSEDHSLIEAKRIEKDAGIIKAATEE